MWIIFLERGSIYTLFYFAKQWYKESPTAQKSQLKLNGSDPATPNLAVALQSPARLEDEVIGL